jgi:MSHA biogenesis protein MshG
MAVYTWRGRNTRGELVQGQLEGANDTGIADQLMLMGVAPVHITLKIAKEKKDADPWWERLSQQPVALEDVLIFSRQMHTLNKAGIPILRAFAGLQASATKPAVVAMLKDMQASLDQGRELSVALTKYQPVFGAFYIAMIRVGEMTGRLTEVFLNLTNHLEFERDVRERIKQATRYPVFVMVAMAIALVVVNIFVIPVFAKVFEGFNAELPLITRGLLAFSGLVQTWWPLFFASMVLGVLMFRGYIRTQEGRYKWDGFKLRLPIAGDIIFKATLARFARSFALASQSGLPLPQALSVVAQTVDNAFLGSRILQMRNGIERGETITRCASATNIFTPVVLQMMGVGEETGELDALLFEIATLYERDTDYSIKGLAAAIEPILLTFIGGLVLLLALGVFLPLWNMGQAAMGGAGV